MAEQNQQSQTAVKVEDPYKGLTPAQRAGAIMKKYSIKDTDGRDMFVDEDAVYRDMSMSAKEAKEFLGGKDPNIYFKDGLVHTSLRGYLGDVLGEDREEVQALRKVIKSTDVIMFKHRRTNQYTILVPKKLSEYELTPDGEFMSKYVHQDYRVIAFTGQMGIPSAFEEDYFRKVVATIHAHLKNEAQKRGVEFA